MITLVRNRGHVEIEVRCDECSDRSDNAQGAVFAPSPYVNPDGSPELSIHCRPCAEKWPRNADLPLEALPQMLGAALHVRWSKARELAAELGQV